MIGVQNWINGGVGVGKNDGEEHKFLWDEALGAEGLNAVNCVQRKPTEEEE